MIEIKIPGREKLEIDNLVLDYNGTLAIDGKLIPAVAERLGELKKSLNIYIVTADTNGNVKKECSDLGVNIIALPKEGISEEKGNLVRSLPGSSIGIGNGYNDYHLFLEAEISIGVIGGEGFSTRLYSVADLICTDICDALDLLIF